MSHRTNVRTTTSALLFALAFACSPPAAEAPKKTPPPPVRPPSDADERVNLLNYAHGAVLVSRTAELNFDQSALYAVDGDPETPWSIVPGDMPQSIVVALPARSRIEQVGVRTGGTPDTTATSVVFETSLDGADFHPLTTMHPVTSPEPQLMRVTPAEASYIRATIAQGGRYAMLNSVQARGRELEPPRAGAIDGCWTINGRTAAFRREGTHVSGFIETATVPIILDGDDDGRLYRFLWTRGPEFGYAAISVSSDGRHLSGAEWHEEPIKLFFAAPWFGERATCSAAVPATASVAQAFLAHGRLPLFALHSEATLRNVATFVSGNEVRLVGHEFHEATAEANRRRADAELTWLKSELERRGAKIDRVSFVTAGSDNPRQYPASDAVRELYSTIDLEPAIRR